MHKFIQDVKKHKAVKNVTKYIENPKVKKTAKNYLKYLGYTALGFLTLVIALSLFYLATVPLPDISNFDKRIITESTKIYDKTGKILLYDNHNSIRRTVVDLNKINPLIPNAIIATEDAEFYKHHGVRVKSIIRASFSTIFKGETQGGSTLTQQIVKNTLLTREKTISRKIKEIIIAIRLEQKLTKDQILEIYLNEAPYSGNVYGVEEASQVYFKKHALDVSLAEAAYLAAIPQSPVYYDPNGKHRDELDVRQRYVLSRMETLGYITKEQQNEALNEKVFFVPKAQTAVKAPHFVFFIRDYLIKKYGEDRVNKEGLHVISTLDYDLQVFAEEEAKKEAERNERDYNGKNIALVALDPKTGHILSMVGSRDFFDKEIDGQFNVATAARQPGSSFKPFVYATAFKKGYRPETVLFDTFTEFNTNCSPDGKGRECYSPENFDSKFKGPMQLKNALAESRNIPSVKLLYLAGISDSIATARSMGITTLGNPKDYGLSLVLGAGEVKLLDMVSAYGVFANNGIKKSPTGILKIEDKKGEILEEYKENAGEQILPDYVTSNISKILSNEDLRSPTFGRGSSLHVPGYSVAVKTGTTNSNRDAWIVGYSPRIVVGAWAGNNENTPMKKGGAQLAGPLFNKVITKYLQTAGNEEFLDIPMPETGGPAVLRGLWQGGESFYIDSITGGKITDFTPQSARVEKVITNVHTILYWLDKDNPTGGIPKNPQSDPQFNNWEYGVRRWFNNNGAKTVTSADIPNYYDTAHTNIINIPVTISGFERNNEFKTGEKINIIITAETSTLKKVDLFLNNRKITTLLPAKLDYEIDLNQLNLQDGDYTIKAIAYDNLLYQGEDVINFKFKKTDLPPIENQ